MKKLICFAAGLMMMGLTACNNEPGPEYTTLPIVSDLELTPRVAQLSENDEIESVAENVPVVLRCQFTNTYGWSRVYLSYRTMTEDEYKDKSDSEINQIWLNKFSSKEDVYKAMDYVVTYESPVEKMPFVGTIPGQAAGTRVRWDFGYFNQYGLGTGYIAAGVLPLNEYEVESHEALLPDDDPELPQE